VPHRAVKVLLRKPLTTGRAARLIAFTTILVTVVGGVLMRVTDPTQFRNVGDGLWWAIQTVTTVGYGDEVPRSTIGRLVAGLVMIVGIGFLTVITATITSAFVENARRHLEGTTTDALTAKLDQIGVRLDAIEVGLKDIGVHRRDAPQ
jgi:voltage-gated potassium channel